MLVLVVSVHFVCGSVYSVSSRKVASAGTKWIPKPRRGKIVDLFAPEPCQRRPLCIDPPPFSTPTLTTSSPSGSSMPSWQCPRIH